MSKIFKTASIILLFLSSCAYNVHRAPYESVSIGRIENRTFEHGLEDRLNTLLAEELMRSGMKVDEKSPYRIEGAIERFDLKGIAQKGEVTVQYEVFIEASFTLKSPEGERPLKTSTTFPVTFSSEGPLEEIIALKEEAGERALRDMAQEITAAILFR